MFFNQAKYSYKPASLRRCIRSEDFWKYKIPINQTEKISKSAALKFYSDAKFKPKISSTSLNNRQVFSCKNIEELLCIRRTDQILSKTFDISPANRDNEVRQLIEIIKTENYGKVFRSDISSFFESISFSDVISRLIDKGFKNQSCINYLYEINEYLISKFNYEGLPRGLSISTTLSEFIMQEFDKEIINEESIIYYSRFVDDFTLIFSDEKMDIQSVVVQLLPLDLILNKQKTQIFKLKSKESISFLGYEIGLNQKHFVQIEQKKIGKAKKRIILSFKDYLKNEDFTLLEERIRYLSSNIILQKNNRKKKVYTGYKHVYKLCDDDKIIDQLIGLDSFKMSIVNSDRYKLGKILRKKLGKKNLRKIKKLSFKAGFTSNITHQMDREQISKIKKIWEYG